MIFFTVVVLSPLLSYDFSFHFSDQRQANASLVAQLPPSSPTIVFDHPIIGFDQPPNGNGALNPENGKNSQKGDQMQDKKDNTVNAEKEEKNKEKLSKNAMNKKAPHAPQSAKFIRYRRLGT